MTSISERHDTAGWQAIDRKHFLHPFTDTKALHETGARIITRADGVYLWDSNGARLLDGMAGLWCVNVGYGRSELADVAAEQMRELPYYNSFFKTANPPVLALSELLAEVTPAHMNHVMFTSSGSESNDTIVRYVRRYWDVMGQPQRKTIISRWQAYHGSTVAGASLSGMKAMHAHGDLPIPGIVHIDPPYSYALGGDLTPAAFGLRAAGWLEAKIIELGADTVAAFIGEPIQGAGGVIIPPATYWPEIERICRQYGILLIADEVICGFGRTGHWFGCETFGFKPDMMAMAKGMSSGYLPIGGVMVADNIAQKMIDEGGEFFHGYTYSGHPTCSAVAERNIRIIRDEGLVERVRDDTGPYLQRRWRELEAHPLVGEARGIGFIGALELVRDKGTRQRFDPLGEVGTLCRDFCFANGLVMRAVWDTLIISPPLVMTHAEIDELIDLARRCLDLTAGAVGIPS